MMMLATLMMRLTHVTKKALGDNVPDVLFQQGTQPLLSSCSACHAPLMNGQKAL
jgi:mono/diheme cytochrome c family protein